MKDRSAAKEAAWIKFTLHKEKELGSNTKEEMQSVFAYSLALSAYSSLLIFALALNYVKQCHLITVFKCDKNLK